MATFFVDSGSGDDTNDGSDVNPIATNGRAIELVTDSDVRVAAFASLVNFIEEHLSSFRYWRH
ncbi:MAG: hypothetical protein AAF402_01635 [Pseudomonadota bacterium]